MPSKDLYYKLENIDGYVVLKRSTDLEKASEEDCTEDVFISMIIQQRAKRLGETVGEYLQVMQSVIDNAPKCC